MKRIVHIGQGKAATTTLQKHVFPAFFKSRKTEYLAPAIITGLIANPDGKSLLPVDCFASSEVLVGLPRDWERKLEKNHAFFGKEATILLVIRRPSGYFRSVFQQVSHHSGLLMAPKTFFGTTDYGFSEIFSPEKFDQERLVKLYAENFNEVIVQKFETVADLEFLRVACHPSDPDMATARTNLSNSVSNRSFSQAAVNLSMKMKWMFGSPVIDMERGKIKRTLRYKLWRSIVQGFFDKVYPYEKYRLDWSQVPNVDMNALDAAYDALPPFQHYINGVIQPVD